MGIYSRFKLTECVSTSRTMLGATVQQHNSLLDHGLLSGGSSSGYKIAEDGIMFWCTL